MQYVLIYLNNQKNKMKPTNEDQSCCEVQAVVTVDARGQLVLPKDVREQAGIRPGDKLAVVTMRKEGRVCCLSLMKTDAFAPMVRQVLGPLVEKEVSHG
jgi:AbrB family looped-hinge helix DNA binding protein